MKSIFGLKFSVRPDRTSSLVKKMDDQVPTWGWYKMTRRKCRETQKLRPHGWFMHAHNLLLFNWQ
jgi:hypothetical protein